MSDSILGFLILGIAMLVVLGVVFLLASRGPRSAERSTPPSGVHLPNPSFLPVLISVSGVLIGAGFAFKGDWPLANPFLAIPGAIGFVLTVIGWVRAANREWVQVEHGAGHDDGAAH